MTQVRLTVFLNNDEELQSTWTDHAAKPQDIGNALHGTKALIFNTDETSTMIVPAASIRCVQLETRPSHQGHEVVQGVSLGTAPVGGDILAEMRAHGMEVDS